MDMDKAHTEALDEDEAIYDEGCDGHEVLRGDMMGQTFYCDGSCKTHGRPH